MAKNYYKETVPLIMMSILPNQLVFHALGDEGNANDTHFYIAI
uniref:Uncharacterized protein n=1 Tax=Rhizophora mucronata TaxID=61149 RepID=A0A2P2PF78_RHIMU